MSDQMLALRRQLQNIPEGALSGSSFGGDQFDPACGPPLLLTAASAPRVATAQTGYLHGETMRCVKQQSETETWQLVESEYNYSYTTRTVSK